MVLTWIRIRIHEFLCIRIQPIRNHITAKIIIYPSNFSGMKFLEDEINLLIEVITRHPPPSSGGVHLVSLGLAMLLAFNSLIGTPALEKQVLLLFTM